MVSKKLIRDIRTFTTTLDIPISKLYLFGSRAYGKPNKHSDVDLLVVSPQFTSKRRLARSPPLYLQWNLDHAVDFVCLSPEEFARKKKEIGVVQQAVKKGIKII